MQQAQPQAPAPTQIGSEESALVASLEATRADRPSPRSPLVARNSPTRGAGSKGASVAMALWQSPQQLPAALPALTLPEPQEALCSSMPEAAPSGKCAVAAAESAEDFVVSLAELLRILGQALHSLHGYQCGEALAALRLLPARERKSAWALALQGRCHFELADYEGAAQVYSRCCDAHRLHSGGLEYYSTALWQLRKSTSLGILARNVLDWDRSRPQVWCVIGNCFSLQLEHEQAIRFFRRAIQVEPSFVYAYTLMGHEYTSLEKYEKAVQMYERALSIDRRHYNAWWGLGSLYSRQEDHQKAQYHFQHAVAINRNNAVLQLSMGLSLGSLGEPERALEHFAAASRSSQCSAPAAFQQGSMLAALGRHQEAIPLLRRAQKLAPREAAVHFQLGRSLTNVGDARRALLHFTMAMDLCGGKDTKDHEVIAAAQLELLRNIEGSVHLPVQQREHHYGEIVRD